MWYIYYIGGRKWFLGDENNIIVACWDLVVVAWYLIDGLIMFDSYGLSWTLGNVDMMMKRDVWIVTMVKIVSEWSVNGTFVVEHIWNWFLGCQRCCNGQLLVHCWLLVDGWLGLHKDWYPSRASQELFVNRCESAFAIHCRQFSFASQSCLMFICQWTIVKQSFLSIFLNERLWIPHIVNETF